MKIVRMNEIPKEPISSRLFTGPDMTRQDLELDSKEYRLSIVNFGKGIRNKFHAHVKEQILIVTGGRGIVATEQEEKVVTEGDVIIFPAGEKHWHGAVKDSEFSHLFVTALGGKTTQFED